MNIHLPIDEVDKFVEIAMIDRLEWKVSRRQYKRPERIVYSLTNKELESSKHDVILYPLDRTHTKIVFPVQIKESQIFPSPFGVGGNIKLTVGLSDVDKKIKEKPAYKICHSIWITVKLQEYLRAEDVSKMEKEGVYLPLKPPVGADMNLWFEYQLACEKAGFKYTLVQMANDSGYSEGTLKNAHGNWKREKGLK